MGEVIKAWSQTANCTSKLCVDATLRQLRCKLAWPSVANMSPDCDATQVGDRHVPKAMVVDQSRNRTEFKVKVTTPPRA